MITTAYARTMARYKQVTTLLFQKGIDPGVTDLLWMPER